MPLYEYECESCGVTFEVIQKFTDHSVDTCRSCGGHVRRLLSAPAIQFKGTGWYITDYARKGARPSESDTPSTAKTADSAASSTSTPSTESKSPGGSSSTGGPTASSSTTSSGDKK
jgi:putative FmdB family regulatory protein